MPRILIIDDEEGIRNSLSRLFAMEGYETVTAEDGVEGGRILDEQEIDLVISDIVMPNKDGIEFLTDMAQSRPDLKIITISGGARMAEGDDLDFLLGVASGNGAIRAIKKPFDNDTILAAVKESLES